jgi:hypothetical protein
VTNDVEALPGPEPGQLVRIAIPDEGRATASIISVAPTSLALRLTDRSTLRGVELCGASAALEWVADEGIHRLLGELKEPPYLDEDGLLFIPRSGPQFLGRRRHLRAMLDTPVLLTSDDGERYHGITENLSEGGMLVSGVPEELGIAGATFTFALAPRDCEEPIVGTCVAIRAEEDGRVGFNFDPLPREAADELARIVYEQAAKTLRRPATAA